MNLITLFLLLFPLSSYSLESGNYTPIFETYGQNDLAEKPAFQGGYINFGYWRDIENFKLGRKLTKQDRIDASFSLYKLIIDQLAILPTDQILEVGCGRGYGAAYIAKKYSPKLITGIDVTKEQIERANIIHHNETSKYNLAFREASSDNMGHPDGYFDKIYSVEAAQYFPSINDFAKEALRILKPGGKLVITAHFSSSPQGYEEAKKLLPTVASDVDRMIPIDSVRQSLTSAGFHEINIESIGGNVFNGFDVWADSVKELKWVRDMYYLFLNHSINYYVITLVK